MYMSWSKVEVLSVGHKSVVCSSYKSELDDTGNSSINWYNVMDYHVFVPIPIFLPQYLFLSHRRLLKGQSSIFL